MSGRPPIPRITVVAALATTTLWLALPAGAQIPAKERNALIALYNATGGADWRRSDGWLGVGGTECAWHGVTCYHGSVQSLVLPSNHLVGTIPPVLGQLAALTELELDFNQLTGTVPPQLGDLSQLARLGLANNQLSGTIPHELGALSRLELFRLDGNELEGTIPPQLGDLWQLQSLGLGANQLTGTIPHELGGLSNLLTLYLAGNLLDGTIPEELGQLANLQWLALLRNQLTGTIPEELSQLANLQWLSLDSNQLSGTIPPQLGSMAGLRALDLRRNQLTGTIPLELGNLIALRSLWLDLNQLTGPIPSILGSLPALEDVLLSYNQLTGSIPPELGGSSNLWRLRLKVNQLSGTIPPELGELASLQALDLHGNVLSGMIPSELGRLGELRSLRLAGNRLAGEIPTELADLGNLSDLDLCGNALFTDDPDLRAFLDGLQPYWQACQEILAVDVGDETPVSDPMAVVSSELGSATDRRGNRVMVWKQSAGTARTLAGNMAASSQVDSVFGRYLDPDDEPVGDVLEVATGAGVDSPTVSFDAAGNFVIGWESAGVGILSRTFGPDQSPLTGIIQIDDQPGLAPESPRVATAAAGDFVMAWRAAPARQAGDGVFGRFFDVWGRPKGESVLVSGDEVVVVSNPAVATDAAGNTVIVWQQSAAGKQGDDGVFGSFFDPRGAPQGDPVRLDDGSDGEVMEPDVGCDALGHAVVVWSQGSSDGSGSAIHARRVDVSGTPLGDQFPVSVGSAGDQGKPSVGANAQGDFAVAWESSGDGVFGRFFTSGGTPVGLDFEVAAAVGELTPASPRVVVGNDDTVTVTYTKADATGTGQGVFFRTLSVEVPEETCVADATSLCLNDNRFQVRAAWRDFADNSGVGQAVALTGDTGYFWFFSDSNIDLILKVLDGTAINAHYWVFFGALSNVEYSITVTDSETGRSVTYHNPQGNFASVGDIEAFPQTAGDEPQHRLVAIPADDLRLDELALYSEFVRAGASPPLKQGSCVPGPNDLCLIGARFQIEVAWEDFSGGTGEGRAVPLTTETGYFWLFNDANVELVLKVLDGTAINGHYWVFYGALTNVAYTITVTDTVTGDVRTYPNWPGEFASVGDTEAFPGP